MLCRPDGLLSQLRSCHDHSCLPRRQKQPETVCKRAGVAVFQSVFVFKTLYLAGRGVQTGLPPLPNLLPITTDKTPQSPSAVLGSSWSQRTGCSDLPRSPFSTARHASVPVPVLPVVGTCNLGSPTLGRMFLYSFSPVSGMTTKLRSLPCSASCQP